MGVPALQPIPHLTVLENPPLARCGFTKDAQGEAEEKFAMEYLERVKIPEQANKYPGQLSGVSSGGWRSRGALCMKPKIMLFDEPLGTRPPRWSRRCSIP